MRDAIVYSMWPWEALRAPERIALALADLGCRVLHCDPPVSFRRIAAPALREVGGGIHVLKPGFLSYRLNSVPGGALLQTRMLRRQITAASARLGLRNPMFVYNAQMQRLFPLCTAMKRDHFMVYLCVDHSVESNPQFERYAELADKTLAIPKSCYHKYKARYGDKVVQIPQSGNARELIGHHGSEFPEPPALSGIPRPRIGYWGYCAPGNWKVNTPLIRSVLESHPEWNYVFVGSKAGLPLPNAHPIAWGRPEQSINVLANLDVALMAYNCFDEEHLHCVPLKLFDHFAFGTPVVATPVIHLWEYKDLVYLGDSAEELSAGIKAALNEPLDSPKRAARMEIARKYSLKHLAGILRQHLPLEETAPQSASARANLPSESGESSREILIDASVPNGYRPHA